MEFLGLAVPEWFLSWLSFHFVNKNLCDFYFPLCLIFVDTCAHTLFLEVNFNFHIVLHATPDEVACWAFPLTLLGGAREWFRTLPSHSIMNFESLAKKFASQFVAGIVRKKPAQQLMTIRQGPQESLRSYLLRFNQKRLAAENQSEQFIHCAIYQGIRKDGALMANLARRPAEVGLCVSAACRPPAYTALTPSRHRQQAAGRRYRFRLPTSVRSAGEMIFP
jgi:hypothetical protein